MRGIQKVSFRRAKRGEISVINFERDFSPAKAGFEMTVRYLLDNLIIDASNINGGFNHFL